ncbi:hypothetical protein BN59_00741 [Legionella massiliensis]|uniref:DUF4189 domain-containing protein n=1 Tax=Legionella massiliensis TaxID=1034943 RepID=A0A078KU28_9GAMM|nr:hypothetical protein [Legionella massiliensis]CDZ76472.1 hypothetical protein BN59_00741 [Legionella massiliensis]CEE12210.1 hypothetical protein BN1094_00741 [Legionella massiliensis]
MHVSKGILVFLLSLWIPSLQAAVSITQIVVWQCDSYDRDTSFNGYGSSEGSSMHNAMSLCKKESKSPGTCKVSQEYCDALVNGQSIRPWWQCKALDSLGYLWVGSFYRLADNALLDAKSRCFSFSAVPATCYTNAFTCKKLTP